MTQTSSMMTSTKVFHNLTLQGSDLDITMAIEYMNTHWFIQWRSLLNIKNVTYDLGSDTVTFDTYAGKTSLEDMFSELSSKFERIHFMYHYFDEISGSDHEENLLFILNGNLIDEDPQQED